MKITLFKIVDIKQLVIYMHPLFLNLYSKCEKYLAMHFEKFYWSMYIYVELDSPAVNARVVRTRKLSNVGQSSDG
jgi:hypothetical protein